MSDETNDGASTPEAGDLSLDAAAETLLKRRQPAASPEAAPEAKADPSDDDGGDEAAPEVEAEAEAEGVEEEQATEEAPETERFTVKVDGKDLEVDRAELIRGYQRLSDYTRKTQAVAEERRSLEVERGEIARLRSEAQARFEAAAKFEPLTGLSADEARMADLAQRAPAQFYQELVQLSTTDPALAVQLQAKIQAAMVHRQIAAQEAAALAAQDKAERMEKAAAQLTRRIPEWADEKVANVEKPALAKYAVEVLGLKPQELASIEDPRIFEVMRKAWKYDQAREKVAKVPPKPAPKVVKPGPATDRNAAREDDLKRARTQLGRSGSIKDAAQLLALRRAQ